MLDFIERQADQLGEIALQQLAPDRWPALQRDARHRLRRSLGLAPWPARGDLGARVIGTVEVVFDRALTGRDLDVVQLVLSSIAPKWSSKLRLWREPNDQRAIDMGLRGALKSAVLEAIGERGSTYKRLAERFGEPPQDRVFGSAELRGTGPELVVIVAMDETVLGTLGARQVFGNRISLQVRRPRVEGRPSDQWMREAFEKVCSDLSPAWGSAGDPAEYWAKVMIDAPRIEAVGRDFGRYLPGLFWLNFFGSRIRDLVAEDRLRSTPAGRLAIVDDGVLVEVAPDPMAWETPEYARSEASVRDHLGTGLFFSKDLSDRATVVPDWNG